MRKDKNAKLVKIDQKMGSRWQAYRKRAKLTLKAMAERLGQSGYFCHPSSINRLESGRSQPDHFQTFIMLACDIYRVTPDELFGASQPQEQK